MIHENYLFLRLPHIGLQHQHQPKIPEAILLEERRSDIPTGKISLKLGWGWVS